MARYGLFVLLNPNQPTLRDWCEPWLRRTLSNSNMWQLLRKWHKFQARRHLANHIFAFCN